MLAHLQDMPHLMASLLSGAGLRLMECLCVRVKDLDFASHQITGRDGKGGQDRMTMLPQVVEDACSDTWQKCHCSTKKFVFPIRPHRD